MVVGRGEVLGKGEVVRRRRDGGQRWCRRRRTEVCTFWSSAPSVDIRQHRRVGAGKVPGEYRGEGRRRRGRGGRERG